MGEAHNRRAMTVTDLGDARTLGRALTMVTAYDHPSARIAEQAGVDMILVGDSAAMVVLGRSSTTEITLDELVMFTRAVVRGAPNTLVVGDLPFMSYQPSDADAIRSAGRLVAAGGAACVKLEGGGLMVDRVRAITSSGIAVIGHLGLTPQSASSLGGFRAQARTAYEAAKLLDDARDLEAAGAVALVLEAVPPVVAQLVTERIGIPTIGIGSGAATTGQVLVWHDLLGYGERVPRFVRRFGDIEQASIEAVRSYVGAVSDGTFPAAEHVYAMPHAEVEALDAALLQRAAAATTSIDAARGSAGRAG